MFKHLPLLWANLGRKKLRTGLTLASIVVAFLLFGLMQTLRVALTGSPEMAGVDRAITHPQSGDHQSDSAGVSATRALSAGREVCDRAVVVRRHLPGGSQSAVRIGD